MSFVSKLGELFTEFTLRGVDVFQAGLKDAQAGLDKVAVGAAAVGAKSAASFTSAAAALAAGVSRAAASSTVALGALQQGLQNVQQGLQKVASLANALAFNKVTLALSGLVTAGVAVSSMGQVLQFQTERLARTLAGLFGPEIQKIIAFVTRLTDKLQSLTDAQRAQIVRWVEAAAAALAVALVLPRVVAGIELAVGAVRALTAALASSGWGTILVAVGLVAGAFLSIGAGAEVAQGGLGRLFSAVQPLFSALATLAGKVVAAFEPVLAVAAQVFGGVVAAVVRAVPPVAEFVGRLAAIVQRMTEALAPLVPVIIDVFGRWLDAVVQLLPPLADLVSAVAEALTPALEAVVLLWVAVEDAILAAVPAVVAVAKAINAWLVPQLQLTAWWLGKIVQGLAWLTGTDLEKQAKLQIEAPEATPGRGMLAGRVGGKESFSALWDRLAEASRMVGVQSPEEKTHDLLGAIFGEQKNTTQAVKNIKPDVRSGKAG